VKALEKNKVLVITGPTATGKTALGAELAITLGGEVVSADSMQIYKGMDIGTAKVKAEETLGVAHHMIDIIDPTENFSVAHYVKMADECVKEILSRGKVPIIVGGTGLYIDCLLRGMDFAEEASDPALRESLENEYDEKGGEFMLEKLSTFDPLRAEKLHPADKKRVLRAMEVFYLTGKTISDHDRESALAPPRYESLKIALSYKDRQKLYMRIDERAEIMVKQGLLDEVSALLERGIPQNSTAMQGIGYKEMALHINGEISLEEALESIKRESRRYAKRQLTWLRRDGSVRWIFRDEETDFAYARQLSTGFFG
jgi:tRNA dimethylallyltransferase